MSKYEKNKTSGGYDPNDPKSELPFADTIILPRDKESSKKRHLAVLKSLGAEPVPEKDFPKDARGSWMSIQRNVTTPGIEYPDAIPLRDQIQKRLDESTITIYVNESNDQPVRIALDPFISAQEVYDIYKRAGYPDIKKPKKPGYPAINCVGMLVETSKMGCYSFNLPAGPNHLGGTCPASALGFMYSTRNEIEAAQKALRDPSTLIDPLSFICNGCYALKGQYGAPSNIFYMMMKYFVTERLLANELAKRSRRGGAREAVTNLRYMSADNYRAARKFANKEKPLGKKRLNDAELMRFAQEQHPDLLDPVDFGFSELMFLAIEKSRDKVRQRRDKLEHFGYTAAEYEATERKINLVLNREEARKLMDAVELAKNEKKRAEADAKLHDFLNTTKLTVEDVLAPAEKIKEVFADWQLPDPDYFRIHDAGDFFSDPYLQAWVALCESIPDVWFWAPTRVWAFRGILSPKTLREIPNNLAMRPSTLHFRKEAPTAAYLESLGMPKWRGGGGLSAASGSAPETPTENDWKCPAYEHWTEGGGAIRLDPKTKRGVGGTCITARGPNGEMGCRACWRYNDRVVFYEEH